MRCDLENCGICQGGRDYRGMRWWPQPVLTYYAASEQRRGRQHWFTTKDELTAATSWSGP